MTFQAEACLKLVAVIFILSAVAKGIQPKSMEKVWAEVGLKSPFLQECSTLILIAWEAGLGSVILLNPTFRGALFCLMLTLIGMMLVMMNLHLRGYRETCSCYGTWLLLSPLETLKLDAVYLAMVVFAWSNVPDGEFSEELSVIPILIASGITGLGKLRYNNKLV